MDQSLLMRCLAITLAAALAVPAAGVASTVSGRPSSAPKAAARTAPTMPAAAATHRGPQQPASAVQPQLAKPRHHWPRVSLLKTIIIAGVAAALTGIVVWRSHKTVCTNCVCGACGLPPGP